LLFALTGYRFAFHEVIYNGLALTSDVESGLPN